jgi:hypothetical protein
MGGSEEVRKKIVTRIEVNIETVNQEYMKLVNSKTNEVMNKATQNQETRINDDKSALNDANLARITVSGGSSFNMVQYNKLKVTARAILNITQETGVINQIINDSKTQVQQALSSNTQLQSDLKLVTDITKKKENSGEFNTFVDKVASMVDAITGKDTKDETEIENTIKQSLKTENIQSLDISEFVRNTFKTDISQNSINSCSSNTSGGNIITLTDITISGGSSFESTQKNIVEQTQECILSATLSASFSEYLKNANDVLAGQTIENIVANKMKLDSLYKDMNLEGNKSYGDIIADVIKSMMSNVVIVIIIVCIIGAIVLGPTIIGMFKQNGQPPSYSQATNGALNKALKFIINFSK